ncbi:hypothetical protein [Actinoplanes sp. NBRC 103695]|uniref:hypothetical protein n=1 Tax=Actinoplanes sp. NBRC 103695 TaxID=3032202 RepID=UPI0024A528A8|nr:hypothetical protein [Actinoplanes sp. NBRC 103695]GLY99016.1 hypothetical protein Acsp02_62700 [Actinoplanes sp. NBRC 103695]
MRTVSRRLALWRADLSAGVCAAPEECVASLGESAVTVVLEHRERGLTSVRHEFPSVLRQDVEWQFDGITWPSDLRPGVHVTVTWSGKDQVVVRTVPLDEPVRVDGLDYFHEYDPKVVTREYDAGTSNRGKVLHAVRRQGRIFDDGSAALASSAVARLAGLGRGQRGAFLLDNALDQLIREGYLTRVTGSVDSSGYPSYPAMAGQKEAEMLFYAPLVEPVPVGDDRAEHWVNGFVRKLPPGAHASERQVTLHEESSADTLEPGYTYVKRHHRG